MSASQAASALDAPRMTCVQDLPAATQAWLPWHVSPSGSRWDARLGLLTIPVRTGRYDTDPGEHAVCTAQHSLALHVLDGLKRDHSLNVTKPTVQRQSGPINGAVSATHACARRPLIPRWWREHSAAHTAASLWHDMVVRHHRWIPRSICLAIFRHTSASFSADVLAHCQA